MLQRLSDRGLARAVRLGGIDERDPVVDVLNERPVSLLALPGRVEEPLDLGWVNAVLKLVDPD